MFRTTLFKVVKICTKFLRPFTDEHINKIWYKHIMEIIQQYEKMRYQYIFPCGYALKTLFLMNETRHKRLHIVLFHLYQMHRMAKSVEKESRLWLPKAGL